jgi:hypothetical protein
MSTIPSSHTCGATCAEVLDRPFGWQFVLFWWMPEGLERPGA